jgi:hypothetical protein
MTLVIVTSVGGALATRPQADCRIAPQYYSTGGGYMSAGKLLNPFAGVND